MSRRQKDPLRPLSDAERLSLSRLSRSQNLFESAYRAGARIGIGLSSASKPEMMPTRARRAAETSSRPPRSLARPPQWDSQPKLRSTTQRRAGPTKAPPDGAPGKTPGRLPRALDPAPKLRSTPQRRASTTKPLADGSRETTRWRMPWTFDHARQRSAANAPS